MPGRPKRRAREAAREGAATPPKTPPPGAQDDGGWWDEPHLDDKAIGMFAIGCSVKDVCGVYGLQRQDFYAMLRKNPQLAAKIEEAKARAIVSIVKRVFDKAIEGDMAAARYWLNNRARESWSSQVKVDVEIPGEGAAQKPEIPGVSYEELIELARVALAEQVARKGEVSDDGEPQIGTAMRLMQ
jgi:hypothetical protein